MGGIKRMIYMCSSRIYKYGKWTFEYGMSAFSPLTKAGEPYKRIPLKFYEDLDTWLNLNDKEKEKYRIGGGCERLG